MLAALLSFLVIAFIGWYASLMKRFRSFVKRKGIYTQKQLWCLLISNFVIVLGTVMIIVITIGSIYREVNNIHTSPDAMVTMSVIVGIIVAFLGDYFINKQYHKQVDEVNKESKLKDVEDVKL